MELFFITIMFLAFCITVIVLSSKRADIAALGIKTLGQVSRVVGRTQNTEESQD